MPFEGNTKEQGGVCLYFELQLTFAQLTDFEPLILMLALKLSFLSLFSLLNRDQPGNGRESCRHRQHAAVASDAQVLERKAPGLKETGIL